MLAVKGGGGWRSGSGEGSVVRAQGTGFDPHYRLKIELAWFTPDEPTHLGSLELQLTCGAGYYQRGISSKTYRIKWMPFGTLGASTSAAVVDVARPAGARLARQRQSLSTFRPQVDSKSGPGHLL